MLIMLISILFQFYKEQISLSIRFNLENGRLTTILIMRAHFLTNQFKHFFVSFFPPIFTFTMPVAFCIQFLSVAVDILIKRT